MKKKIIILTGILLGYFIGGSIACTEVNSDTVKVKIKIPTDTIKIIQKDTFGMLTQQKVYNMIVEAGILHPKIVLRQAILETGWFKSSVCKFNYNLFGFTGMNGYMKYDNYQKSIDDYKQWQDKFYYDGNYYIFLDQINYAEDTNYVETLKRIKINVQSTNISN